MKTDFIRNTLNNARLTDPGDFPKVVLIDTISYCNLKCSMCVHEAMTRKKGIMRWDLFTRIIDEIADTDRSTRVWMVFFGEALLLKRRKPSIFDMIAYAKKRGLSDVVLNSNATLLDEKTAAALVDSGLDAVYFGIDAFTPETYASVRVGGDYHEVVRNIQGLIALKMARGVLRPEIFVQFVEMDANRGERDDFIAFWNAQGAQVKIRPKVSWAGSIEASNLVLGNDERWPCHWAMQTMSITDSGQVVTCAVDLDARYVAGDLAQGSLRSIWNGDLKRLRLIHLTGRFEELPENCRNCRDWQSARADYFRVNP